MNISLLQVLNAPLFENVKILSGRAGLGRIVKRASVFDAPFKEDVLEKDILAPGDFFYHISFAVSAEIRRTDAGSGASCKRKLQWALCDDGGESRAFFERNACFL